MDKFVAFIPVRGGSKSIPLKNIKLMNGKPLVCWTIDAAAKCEGIDKVYVSTDSDKIVSVVEEYKKQSGFEDKVQCVARSAETASDTASTESAMLEFADNYEFENIILIQATSPLLLSTDLDKAIDKYENDGYDSILSVVEQKRFVWKDTEDGCVPQNYDFYNRPRRQDFDGYLVENGAFYITAKSSLQETGCRMSGKVGSVVMSEDTYFEIDEPSDWEIVEKLQQRQLEPEKVSTDIKLFVTDCDGVLTDGGMYYSEHGDELKKFNTLDGMGFALLRNKGIKTAIITGEDTQIVNNRAKKLKIDHLHMGISDKISVLKSIAAEEGIELSQIAYVGDDINDIECLKAAGISFSVPNALDHVKQHADVILNRRGGEGAIREAVTYLLGTE